MIAPNFQAYFPSIDATFQCMKLNKIGSGSIGFSADYRADKKCLYVVARYFFFLALLSFSAWPWPIFSPLYVNSRSGGKKGHLSALVLRIFTIGHNDNIKVPLRMKDNHGFDSPDVYKSDHHCTVHYDSSIFSLSVSIF